MLDRIRASTINGFTDLNAMIAGTPEGLRARSRHDVTVTHLHVPLNNSLIPGVHVDRRPDRQTPSYISEGPTLGRVAFTILLNTPELSQSYGYDEEAFVLDALTALRDAMATCHGIDDQIPPQSCTQPINHFLWPTYDGVAPRDGAGGNNGDHGCVIFAERILQCLGTTLDQVRGVPATTLTSCFS